MTEANPLTSPPDHREKDVDYLLQNTAESGMPTDDLLGSALAYAGMGWRVIPVHPETKIPCNPVTLARLSEWQNLATTDGSTLKQWFRTHASRDRYRYR